MEAIAPTHIWCCGATLDGHACPSHRLEMRVAALVELVVRIAHGLRLGAAEHHLEIDRLERIILIAMDDASRARDAFPWPEPRGDALAALILHEHVEIALQHEEAFLDLVGVGGIALAGRHEHDRERKILRRDHGRIVVLAGAAGADEAVLGALVALDLGVLEGSPVGLLLAKAPDISRHDVLDRNALKLRRTRMPCDAHRAAPVRSRTGFTSARTLVTAMRASTNAAILRPNTIAAQKAASAG